MVSNTLLEIMRSSDEMRNARGLQEIITAASTGLEFTLQLSFYLWLWTPYSGEVVECSER
jgi:hypothetical protein